MLGDIMSLRRPSAPAPSDNNSPKFPLYLLPSLRIPFRRRRTSEPLSPASSGSSTVPSLSSSPISPVSSPGPQTPTPALRRLSRVQPATLRCRNCSTELAFHDQIISKGFTGRQGRAYLVSPPSHMASLSCPRSPRSTGAAAAAADLINIRVGKAEKRLLVTGAHVVADITCACCGTMVGWKYVDASDARQVYKVGKFILETRRVVGFHGWEDADGLELDERPSCELWEDDGDQDGDEVAVFDSDDDDECEEIFSGVWDAKVVAQRRKSRTLVTGLYEQFL